MLPRRNVTLDQMLLDQMLLDEKLLDEMLLDEMLLSRLWVYEFMSLWGALIEYGGRGYFG